MGLTLCGVWPPWVKKDLTAQFGGDSQKSRAQLIAKLLFSKLDPQGRKFLLAFGIKLVRNIRQGSSFFSYLNLKPDGSEIQLIINTLLVTGYH